MKISAIVFDFDGVLVESVSVKGEAFVKLYENDGEDIQAQVAAYHKAHGGVSRFDKIRHFETQLCARRVSEEGVIEIAQRFSNIVEEGVVQSHWVVGAKEALETYHGQVPLYIASATPQDELRRITKARDMAHYFDGIYGTPKTKAESLSAIVTENDLTAGQVLMVGDAITDYNAAQKTGVRFIGRLLPGRESPFPKGTQLIDDLTQLPALIEMIHE